MDLALEAPFVLDTDSDKIARYNARARDEHQVRKDAWPFPFMGNPEAPIVLLNLNPGYKASDVLWQDNDALKHAYRANLRHDEAEYPFYAARSPISRSPWQRLVACQTPRADRRVRA